jgi:HK97 family phage major capsid protein
MKKEFKEVEGEETKPVDAGTEEAEETEESVDDAVEAVSAKIEKKLNLKELREKLDNVLGGKDTEMAKKVFAMGDVNKAVSDLTKEEKIVGFFLSLVNNDKVGLKALSEGTAADGGYLVPDEFMAELIRDLEEPTRMRSLVRVIPMKRDTLKIPKLGSKPKVYWTAENTTKTTSTADFDEKTLTAYKVAAILYASEELVEDAYDFDVVQMIIGLFSEAIAEEEDLVITAGSGTGQPTGLTSCTIAGVTCSGNLDFDNIINLIYSLPAKYRKSAVFLAHNNNIRELRKVKDSNNRYIWLESVISGEPATILGYPIYENNNLPESSIYFGDFKRGYWLGDRRKITVKVSDIAGTAWEHDQIGIRVVERIAGNCVLEAAIRVLSSIP